MTTDQLMTGGNPPTVDAQGALPSSLDGLSGLDFDASLSPGSLRYTELFFVPLLSELSRCIRTGSAHLLFLRPQLLCFSAALFPDHLTRNSLSWVL